MLRGFEGLSASPFAGAFVAPTASLPDSDVDALAYGCGRPQRRGDALKCYLCECAIGLADPAVAKPVVCQGCGYLFCEGCCPNDELRLYCDLF